MLSVGSRKLKIASERWILNSSVSACCEMLRTVACHKLQEIFLNIKVN